jgi:predicted esterase
VTERRINKTLPGPFATVRIMRQFFGLHLAMVLVVAAGLSSCGPKEETLAAPPAIPQAPAAAEPVAIPKVADASGDWAAHAYQVNVLTPVGSDVTTKASVALAWTPAALLLQVRTDDATPVENTTESWESDSVEIFLASSVGSDDHLQFTCIPGRKSDPPSPSCFVDDKRASGPHAVPPEMQTQKDAHGYVMTFSVPWTNLKRVPQPGDTIGLQICVKDARQDGSITQRIWYPRIGAGDDPSLMQAVKLADEAGPPENAAAWLQSVGLTTTIHLSAVAAAAGKKFDVWSSGQKVVSGELQAGGPDGSRAAIPLPEEWKQKKGASLVVAVDGNVLPGDLTVPDLAQQKMALVKNLPIDCHTIFDGAAFPSIDFANRDLVEAAIGPYTVHPRFFDARWNEVTKPDAPGRYGAIVEFRLNDGQSFTRHFTLFKTVLPYAPKRDPYVATVKFPAAFGLPEAAMAKEQWGITEWTAGTLDAAQRKAADWSRLVAGLHDLAADPARLHGFTVWKIDNDWWSELQKRLGENQDYPHLTHLPDDYDKDQRLWPLIIFLHGSGERGSNLNVLQNKGPLGYINQGHPLPFIVVSPQCPEDESWNADRLARLLDQVEAADRVDPRRVYVTGLSLGGFGSLDFAATYPDRVAAIAPLSGGDDPALAERLRKMPAWFFHGAEDDVVPTRYSVDLAHALQKLGAPVKLTVYPGVGHGGWDVTYSNPELYSWFLQQSK